MQEKNEPIDRIIKAIRSISKEVQFAKLYLYQ
jgi:hypothetical protein